MPEYRAYIIGRDGHFKSVVDLESDDDQAAIASAKQLVNGHDVEVWHENRRVVQLSHKE